MRFTDEFEITRSKADDWFDPVLTIDTKLFIDPFLIYASELVGFEDSHIEVIDFFNDAFQLISRTGGDTRHLLWRRAEVILLFPEVQELCLGYSSCSTKGSGSGLGFSQVISSALWEAVQAGIEHFTHFEEVGILREGIGADRISDITANLLRHRFAEYTRIVCERHCIPLKSFRYSRGKYNREFQRWMPCEFNLPENPYNNLPVLLCPDAYLRSLPTISAESFWDYCFTNENETLRNDYSADITRKVDKKTIIDFARRYPDIRQQYIDRTEQRRPEPYNYDRDKKGLIAWYDSTATYCLETPLALHFITEAEFAQSLDSLMEEFRNFVENNRGWSLLWNENRTPKAEEAAQLLFLGIVKHYCKANNIDISREANIGRGPVDFKASQGHQFRALFELKLAKNTRFWSGLERQLPKYQQAEGIAIGYFIVIIYNEKDLERLADIQQRVQNVNAETGYQIKALIVDAQHSPPSASML